MKQHRAKKRARQLGAPTVVPLTPGAAPDRVPGPVEQGVLHEIASIPGADRVLAALAQSSAQICDNPLAPAQHASNARELRTTMRELRKLAGLHAGGGSLASARAMSRRQV